jgi:hypothetical protein
MLQWESIDDEVWRAKIFGGWLVKYIEPVITQQPEVWGNISSFRNEMHHEFRTSICFVPDPKHEWLIPNS